MKKNRVLVWLVVGAVAVVGLCYLALAFRPDSNRARYDFASESLRAYYFGPTVSWVSPFDDPRTKIVPTVDGYRLEGAMRSDNPELLQYAKASHNGEFWFSIRVTEFRIYGVLPGASTSSGNVSFKAVPSGGGWPQ